MKIIILGERIYACTLGRCGKSFVVLEMSLMVTSEERNNLPWVDLKKLKLVGEFAKEKRQKVGLNMMFTGESLLTELIRGGL